jgi:hypothetical protein
MHWLDEEEFFPSVETESDVLQLPAKKEIERKRKFLRRQCNTRQGSSIAVASTWKQNTRLDEGFRFGRSIARASQATR